MTRCCRKNCCSCCKLDESINNNLKVYNILPNINKHDQDQNQGQAQEGRNEQRQDSTNRVDPTIDNRVNTRIDNRIDPRFDVRSDSRIELTVTLPIGGGGGGFPLTIPSSLRNIRLKQVRSSGSKIFATIRGKYRGIKNNLLAIEVKNKKGKPEMLFINNNNIKLLKPIIKRKKNETGE